jgi:hypothetical protein
MPLRSNSWESASPLSDQPLPRGVRREGFRGRWIGEGTFGTSEGENKRTEEATLVGSQRNTERGELEWKGRAPEAAEPSLYYRIL